jgi:hypothetical protein
MLFRLNISAERMLIYYQGSAHQVSTRATDGRRLQFPAEALRRFVTHRGVQGLFEIRFGADHKLVSIERIGD